MIRVLLLIFAVCVSTLTHAQQLQDDSDRHLLICVTSDPPTAGELNLLATLKTDPQLAAITNDCHFHHFTPTSKLYQLRYAQSLSAQALPILALSRSDGGVIWKASGANIPATPALIAKGLMEAAVNDANVRTRQLTTVANYGDEPPSQTNDNRDPNELPVLPFLLPPLLDSVIPDSLVVKPQIAVPIVPIAIGVAVMLVLLAGGFFTLVAFGFVLWIMLR